MRRWFLSYHSTDHAMAQQLKAVIERKDSASRVFLAPMRMRAGCSWSVQLAQEIAEADAFILLIGKEVGSWQVLEYDEALDNWVKAPSDFPLVVVLLEGCTAPGLPFLRRLHWIITLDPASEKDVARILDAAAGSGSSSSGELWRYTSPYRGLEAMQEKDSDYFFGRRRKTVEILSALAGAPDRVPVLIGNSGVGKSSLAQAGVLAALKRQAWPEDAQASNAWPAAFRDSRQWCFLSLKRGADPLKALVEAFLDTWQFAATDLERTKQQNGWIKMLQDGKATLSDLIDATERRRKELDQPKPPGFFLYVDQGEELYVRAEERRRVRFSELIGQAPPDPRLRVMMSLRSDFLGHLQSDRPLFKVCQHIDVPSLGKEELHEIVSRPAQLLSASFETNSLIDIISQRTAEDSLKDVGALPLLSYTLGDMWAGMVQRGDATLRLPGQSFELGGVLVNRTNRFLETHPGAEDPLRRALTLRLATVHEEGEPTKRRAARAEFTDEEWQLVSELADDPNRLLVTVTTDAGETYAEVAHEVIFRRWEKLKQWIAAERGFLAWLSGLEVARRAWEAAPEASKSDALFMGFAHGQAKQWFAKRADDIPKADRQFIEQSGKAARQRQLRIRALVGVLAIALVVGLTAWRQEVWLKKHIYALVNVHPLRVAQERALTPKESFKECTDCPEMIVVQAGSSMMGSPESQGRNDELPQHIVTITKPFAVSKYELTFAEWDTCWAQGNCAHAGDSGFGRGKQPVINVSWDQAREYVAWLSGITGKTYRLLTEAEYEYAARAGTATAYPWGDTIGKNNANCGGCGSQWGGKGTAPVGSFSPNKFGLYDMVGNVWEWTDDCYHDSYQGVPADGSAWTGDGCTIVVRGGSWVNTPDLLRSAARSWLSTDFRGNVLGFRVARTLTP